MEAIFRNIRDITENELRKGTNNFIIYPFSEYGHLVHEILQLDYDIKAVIVDDILSIYNKKIMTTDFFVNVNKNNSVVLLTVGHELFIDKLKSMKIRYLNIHEKLREFNMPEKKEWFCKIKKLLHVRSVVDGEFVRLGQKNDGGYVILNDFTDIKKIYSFGIGRDITFERDMADRGIECLLFDHTIDSIPDSKNSHLLKFYKQGIAGYDKPSENVFSLETLMKENKDDACEDLMLKMDVEGAEWEFLANINSEILNQFKQIIIEYHGVTDVDNKNVLNMLAKIRKTHTPVWLHANNYGRLEEAGGVRLTYAIEVLYINNNNYHFIDTQIEFPWNIDMPNNPDEEEVFLGNFGAE